MIPANFLKRKKWKPNFTEVHEYTLDLQRIAMLRDKAQSVEERDSYAHIIAIMQQVMVIMNTPTTTKL